MESFWDLLRFVDLVLWATGTGIALRVLVLYAGVYAHRHHPAERRHSAGLLPLHVWAIAASWIVVGGSAAGANIARLGEPFSMLIPANFLGFGLGVFALVIILRYERRRVKPPDPRVQDTINLPHEEDVFDGRNTP